MHGEAVLKVHVGRAGDDDAFDAGSPARRSTWRSTRPVCAASAWPSAGIGFDHVAQAQIGVARRVWAVNLAHAARADNDATSNFLRHSELASEESARRQSRRTAERVFLNMLAYGT